MCHEDDDGTGEVYCKSCYGNKFTPSSYKGRLYEETSGEQAQAKPAITSGLGLLMLAIAGVFALVGMFLQRRGLIPELTGRRQRPGQSELLELEEGQMEDDAE